MTSASAPARSDANPNDDGPLGMLDRLFGNRRLRLVGMALSLGLLVLLPLGAYLAASARPTTPAATEPPPLIQHPKDPAARAAYDQELQALQAEAARLKAGGTPRAEIARQMDPRLRALNERFRGK